MSNQVILTGQDLEDGSEEEAAALDQPEELVEEGDEGKDAEEDGEDHEGLNRLNPVWSRGKGRVRVNTHTHIYTHRDPECWFSKVSWTGANLHRWPACSGTLHQLSCSRTTDLCFFPPLQTRSGNSNNTEHLKQSIYEENMYHYGFFSCYYIQSFQERSSNEHFFLSFFLI